MKRNTIPAFTLAVSLAAAVCGQTPQTPQTRGSRTSAGAMKSPDETFMKKAADANTSEIQMGQLAQKNASSDAAKQFGRRMITDHTKLLDDLKGVAATKGVNLPTSLSAKQKATYNRLSAKTGDEFDRDYISTMIKDHMEDIAEFRKESDSGTDPDVKSLASQALPILQEHLRMAQGAAKQLGIPPTGDDAPGNL
jgi:putative membrane protein